MNEVAFTVAGAAAPQGSKRALGRGVMVESSKRVRPWRSDVRAAAEAAMNGAEALDGPVLVHIFFRYTRPAGHFRRNGELSAEGLRRPFPYARGDVDKLARAVLDALTDVVFTDDSRVISLGVIKAYGDRNEARVRVWRQVEVAP